MLLDVSTSAMIKIAFFCLYVFNLSALALLLSYRLHVRKDVARGAVLGQRLMIVACVVALGMLTQKNHPPIRATSVLFTAGVLLLEWNTNRERASYKQVIWRRRSDR